MIVRVWSCLFGMAISIAMGYLAMLALRLNLRAARGGSPWLDGYMPKKRQPSVVYWVGVLLSAFFLLLACGLGGFYALGIFSIVMGEAIWPTTLY